MPNRFEDQLYFNEKYHEKIHRDREYVLSDIINNKEVEIGRFKKVAVDCAELMKETMNVLRPNLPSGNLEDLKKYPLVEVYLNLKKCVEKIEYELYRDHSIGSSKGEI